MDYYIQTYNNRVELIIEEGMDNVFNFKKTISVHVK